jgi:arylsulfatase A-like enzyme
MKHQHAVYASMIHSVDQSVGRIVKKLESLKIADRTLIVLTGDNGGLDRGGKPTDNAPLRAGKGSAYEGGVRVPLIVHWPGVTPVGQVSHQPVVTCDFYPTFLEASGVAGNAAHNAQVDGVSLVPLLKNPQHRLKRDALYWHYPHYHGGGATPHSAVRAGDWKLIEFFEEYRAELYNLKSDIGETRDLAKEQPKRAERLRAQLRRWRRDVGAQLPIPNPDYDPQRADSKPKRP